jgi:hypothetical protein
MSKSVRAGQETTGTLAQPSTTDRTTVVDVTTITLSLDSFDTFRTAAWATEDTLDRLAP